MRSPKPFLDDAVGQFDRGVEIFGILKLRPVEQQFRPLLGRRQISPRKIIDVTRWAKRPGWLGIPPDISIAPRFRDERLEINIEAARQRWLANHFILKVIWRKCGIAGLPTDSNAGRLPRGRDSPGVRIGFGSNRNMLEVIGRHAWRHHFGSANYSLASGGKKFTSCCAEIRTTSSGSVKLCSWLNSASSFCIGDTQNSARAGLSDLLK